MRKLSKKIIFSIVIAVMALSTIVFAAFYAYTSAQISFSGIEVHSNENTPTAAQGFVDIYLKNVNAQNVNFCLKYDDSVIKLSDADTNKVIESTADLDKNHKYFKLDKAFGESNPFVDMPMPFPSMDTMAMGRADIDNGYLSMHFTPSVKTPVVYEGKEYIGYVEGDEDKKMHILADSADGVKLGQISFQIVDADKFSKLTPTELNNIIEIAPFEDMYSGKYATYTNYSNIAVGATIGYVENTELIVDDSISIDTDFKLSTNLKAVKPQTDEIVINAYDVYKTGDEQDLVSLLNERASLISLEYDLGTKMPAVFVWSNTLFNSPITWDPKGGEYHISQPYNDDLNVEITVKVTPVKMTGVYIPNQNVTYFNGAADFPSSFERLNLANKAQPILDTALLNGGIPDIDVLWEYSGASVDADTGLPTGFADGAGSYTFDGTLTFDGENPLTIADITDLYKWLTPPSSLPAVQAVRNVVTDEANMPAKIKVKPLKVENSGADKGVLKVVVEIDSDPPALIADGTKFEIRMPGGSVISDTYYEIDYINSAEANATYPEGSAVITLKGNLSGDEEGKKLAQAINLGDRLGKFTISMLSEVDNGGGGTAQAKSPEVEFVSDRDNIYIAPDSVEDADIYRDGDYIFDYSGLNSALFPASYATTAENLPTTITLPDPAHSVKTMYDGETGNELGALTTITVDAWNEISAESTGNIVTVRGLLKETSYTNYGTVLNPDSVYVVLKYYRSSDTNVDSVKIDPLMFIYNVQQVGYGYDRLQTKEFTVTNDGVTDIYGLWADVEYATITKRNETDDIVPTGETAEAFIVSKKLQPVIGAGGMSTFEITTKHGLPVGIYSAKVTLYSNNKVLGYVTLSFEVTSKPVYNLNVEVDGTDFGTAEAEGGITAAIAGDNIVIKATPNNTGEDIDYIFDGWTIVPGDLTPTEDKTDTDTGVGTLKFVMPESDVTITAKFIETTGAKLRASQLYVMDGEEELNDSMTNYMPLSDKNWDTVAFDAATREYYVAVPNDTDTVKLWFDVQFDEAKNADKTASVTITDVGESGIVYATPTPEAVATPDPSATPEPTADPSVTPKPGLIPKVGTTAVEVHEPDASGYYKTDEIGLAFGPEENLVELTFTHTATEAGETPEEEKTVTTTRKYVFHIFRKLVSDDAKSSLATFAYGNSPYGRIMRAGWSEADINSVKEEFITNGYKFGTKVPQDVDANTVYTPEAWTGTTNYDLDDYSLFLVNSLVSGDGAWDSGYVTFKDSIGREITSDKIKYKRVTVDVLKEANPNMRNGSKNDFANVAKETIELPTASGDLRLLFDKRIRPNVYSLEYIYEDYDGRDITVTKPLIILYPTGDINMSGKADTNDAKRLRERYKDGLDIANSKTVTDCTVGANLFRHRIVDVDSNGYVNMLDGNEIKARASETVTPAYKNILETEVKP